MTKIQNISDITPYNPFTELNEGATHGHIPYPDTANIDLRTHHDASLRPASFVLSKDPLLPYRHFPAYETDIFRIRLRPIQNPFPPPRSTPRALTTVPDIPDYYFVPFLSLGKLTFYKNQ